jgi:hypothetical protein
VVLLKTNEQHKMNIIRQTNIFNEQKAMIYLNQSNLSINHQQEINIVQSQA